MSFGSRYTFNKALLYLLDEMNEKGEQFLIDYVKRSTEEQKRLFDEGKSKCDGVTKISYHQWGRAADIYFQDNVSLCDPKMGFEYWHNRWVDLGGNPMIEWDKNHFEG